MVAHKILRLHQIRYDVDLFVYDATWIASAVLLLVAGTAVLLVAGTAVLLVGRRRASSTAAG